MDEKRYIPDDKGTVAVSGAEDLVKALRTDMDFLERLEGQIEEQKGELRKMAKAVLDAAAPGSKRVYFHGEKGLGLTVTAPDLTKPGNFNLYSKDVAKAVEGAGGAASLGIPEQELFSHQRKVTVTAWVADWVLGELAKFRAAGQLAPGTDELVKTKNETKLQPSVVEKLRSLAAQNKAAQVLLEKCIAKMTVGVEK